jgi:hypothetical protein
MCDGCSCYFFDVKAVLRDYAALVVHFLSVTLPRLVVFHGKKGANAEVF